MAKIFKDVMKDSFEKRGVPERGLSRAPVSFPVRFQLVSEEDYESLRHARPTNERPPETGIVSDGEVKFVDPAIAAIMVRMDRIEEKLDMLLMAGGAEAKKSPKQVMEVAQARDISGSGMRIASSMAMSKGWYIKVMFELPGVPPYQVVALGLVNRSDSRDAGGYFESACQFEAINLEDQEYILSFVLDRQRELAHFREIDF
jgi:hypothetical protein